MRDEPAVGPARQVGHAHLLTRVFALELLVLLADVGPGRLELALALPGLHVGVDPDRHVAAGLPVVDGHDDVLVVVDAVHRDAVALLGDLVLFVVLGPLAPAAALGPAPDHDPPGRRELGCREADCQGERAGEQRRGGLGAHGEFGCLTDKGVL